MRWIVGLVVVVSRVFFQENLLWLTRRFDPRGVLLKKQLHLSGKAFPIWKQLRITVLPLLITE